MGGTPVAHDVALKSSGVLQVFCKCDFILARMDTIDAVVPFQSTSKTQMKTMRRACSWLAPERDNKLGKANPQDARAHDGSNIGLDSSGKRWVVHLEARALVHNLADVVAVGLLVVVDVMLGIGNDLLALDTTDHRLNQSVPKERILTRQVPVRGIHGEQQSSQQKRKSEQITYSNSTCTRNQCTFIQDV